MGRTGLYLLLAATLLVSATYFVAKSSNTSSLMVGELNVQNLTTVRNWKSCVATQKDIPCNELKNKAHTHCYDALIDTNNCLYLQSDECIDFFEFQSEKKNLDLTLPQSFVNCVQTCTPFASEDNVYYKWFSFDYNVCSQEDTFVQ